MSGHNKDWVTEIQSFIFICGSLPDKLAHQNSPFTLKGVFYILKNCDFIADKRFYNRNQAVLYQAGYEKTDL